MKGKAPQRLIKSLKNDTDEGVLAIAFVLQQALPTPKLTSGIQFYKRKLWTYNFCIHNIKTGAFKMYLWDETTVRRGSCEITSCVVHYLSNVEDCIKTVTMFSDNCFGQNKNLVLANLPLIHQDKFDEIRHVIMTPGHSYLPSDRDFGHIEKEVRHANVYSKNHYEHFITKCRQKKNIHGSSSHARFCFGLRPSSKIYKKIQLQGAKFKAGAIFEFTKNTNRGSIFTKVTILASNLQ
ncbi:hypothetical protein AVEN_94336-1 [Araneus ventricosus]|uniref:DUF7869 domain-containing protein n=1 Tax=Araneus ventricosus TaxID=182803 RepID=A0A4Y2EAV1_ARAVE|nr:hypothetical protein AVEN_94336-1 [Araneus ventricosus]